MVVVLFSSKVPSTSGGASAVGGITNIKSHGIQCDCVGSELMTDGHERGISGRGKGRQDGGDPIGKELMTGRFKGRKANGEVLRAGLVVAYVAMAR